MWQTVLMFETNLPIHLALAVEVMLKISVVICVAALVCFVLRHSSAADRHHVWTIAMLSSLLVPISVLVLPAWQPPRLLPNLPVEYTASTIEQIAPPAGISANSSAPSAKSSPQRQIQSPQPVRGSSLASLALLSSAWAVVTILFLIRAGCAIVEVHRLYCRSSEVADPCWVRMLREATARLGLVRQVSLRRSDKWESPVASGMFRPFVLLPKFCTDWNVTKRRSVLLHELAHIKRRDIETLWIANITSALLWFHPLVWYARRRMRIERERACDDMVLEAGIQPSQYSSVLVEFAADRQRTSNHQLALSMASKRHLQDRIKRILDARACRRRLSIPLAVTTTFLFLAASTAIATAGRANAQNTAIVNSERPNVATLAAGSVVGIQVKRSEQESETLGEVASGVVVHQPGYVLTQLSHVDEGRKFQLILASGRRVSAELVLRDKKTNVAVLRALEKISQPSIIFDVDNQLHVGDPVTAIEAGVNGSPSGTDGAIVSLNRTISVDRDFKLAGLIQVAAQPIPEQSGGPLVDRDGKMVGLIVPIRVGNENQMFAIPVNQFASILRLLPDETDPLETSTDEEPSKQKRVFYTGGLLSGGEFRLPKDFDLDVFGAIEMARGSSDLNRCTRAIIVRQLSNGKEQVAFEVDLAEARRNPRRRPLIQAGDTVVLPKADTTLKDHPIDSRSGYDAPRPFEMRGRTH